jgi:sugar-specific transcriptional regulator TrmB
MVAMDERLRGLELLGLRGAAARCYLALLERGPLSARDAATAAGVATNRIYEHLERLEQRHLVERLPVRPLRFCAVPVERVLEERVRRARQEVEVLSAEGPRLVETLRPTHAPAADAAEARLVRGRKAL